MTNYLCKNTTANLVAVKTKGNGVKINKSRQSTRTCFSSTEMRYLKVSAILLLYLTTLVIANASSNKLHLRHRARMYHRNHRFSRAFANRFKRQSHAFSVRSNPILASAYVPETLNVARQNSATEGNSRQAKCPSRCRCSREAEVRCPFSGLTLIPSGIPKTTQKLNLGFNKFASLPPNLLARQAPLLKVLFLQSNELRWIPGAFNNLTHVEVLRLGWNKLTTISKLTLSDLVSLKRLYIDNNKLNFINPEAFLGLKNLRLVQLEGNHLSQLHPDTFNTLRFGDYFSYSHIEYLYLSNNRFTNLPLKLLTDINNLRQVYLHDNPWDCSCQLQWLHQWMRESGKYRCKKSMISRNETLICATCASPVQLKDHVITRVPHDNISCTPPHVTGNREPVSTTIFSDDPSLMEIHNDEALFRFGSKSKPSFALRLDGHSGSITFLRCNASREPVASVLVKDGTSDVFIGRFEAEMNCFVEYPTEGTRLETIIRPYLNSPLNFTAVQPNTNDQRVDYLVKIHREQLNPLPPLGSGLRIQSAALLSNSKVLKTKRSTVTILGSSFHPEKGTLGLFYQTSVTFNDSRQATQRDLPWTKSGEPSAMKVSVRLALEGQSVVLKCRAMGFPRPMLSWILPSGIHLKPLQRIHRFKVYRGGRLVIQNAAKRDSGVYKCLSQSIMKTKGTGTEETKVSEAIGSLRLQVIALSLPNISYIAKNVTVLEGSPWKSSCEFQAVPTPVVALVNPSNTLMLGGHASNQKEQSPYVFENNTLVIRSMEKRLDGLYRCIAINRMGTTQYFTRLTVSQEPTVSKESFPQKVPQQTASSSHKTIIPPFGTTTTLPAKTTSLTVTSSSTPQATTESNLLVTQTGFLLKPSRSTITSRAATLKSTDIVAATVKTMELDLNASETSLASRNASKTSITTTSSAPEPGNSSDITSTALTFSEENKIYKTNQTTASVSEGVTMPHLVELTTHSTSKVNAISRPTTSDLDTSTEADQNTQTTDTEFFYKNQQINQNEATEGQLLTRGIVQREDSVETQTTPSQNEDYEASTYDAFDSAVTSSGTNKDERIPVKVESEVTQPVSTSSSTSYPPTSSVQTNDQATSSEVGVGENVQLHRRKPKKITPTQQLQRVNFGSPFRISCPITGSTRVVWKFYRRGTSKSRRNKRLSVVRITRKNSLPKLTLLNPKEIYISRATGEHNGTFLCRSKQLHVLHRTHVVVDTSLPRITQPNFSRITVEYGKSIVLNCSAEGYPTPFVTWSWPTEQVITVGTVNNDETITSRVYTESANELHLENVTPSLATTYTCSAANQFGNSEQSVTVSVSFMAPAVEDGHSVVSTKIGSSVRLDCPGRGIPTPTHEWTTPEGIILLFGDTSILNTTILSNGSLLISSVGQQDGGRYTCKVTNPMGEASLSLNLHVQKEESLNFRREVSYQVVNTAEEKVSNSNQSSAAETTTTTATTEATTTTVKSTTTTTTPLPPTTKAKTTTKAYTTTETTKRSKTTTLPEKPSNTKPVSTTTVIPTTSKTTQTSYTKFKGNISSEYHAIYRVKQRVAHDQTAFLRCRNPFSRRPYSRTRFGYRMRRRNSRVSARWTTPAGDPVAFPYPAPTWRHRVFWNGTLRISRISLKDMGIYTCIAKGPHGKKSKTVVNLVVATQPPSIHQPLHSVVKVTQGRTASAQCSANGFPKPTIIWTTPSGVKLTVGTYGTGLVVRSSGTLIVYGVNTKSAGTYTCQASNTDGDVTRVVTFKLRSFPPSIRSVHSMTMYVRMGGSIKLMCPVLGVPSPRLYWTLPHGKTISPNEGVFEQGHTRSKIAMLPSGTLTLNRASKSDNGIYRCYAVNHRGTDTKTVQLEVYY